MNGLKNSVFGMIPQEWDIIDADKYCLKVTDGTHDSPKQKNEGYPLVTSRHIKGSEIDFDNTYLISEEDYNDINKRSYVSQWDVIISMIGEYCGFTYLEENPEINYAIKNVGLFKTENEIDSKWLYYFFQSKTTNYLLNTYRSGTSQPYLSLGTLRKFPVLIPKNVEEKREIVSILDSIRLKIELLQAQNKTLEETAQTIFKEWFGKCQIEDELPEGWRVYQLNELVDTINGYSYKGKELVEESEEALVTLKSFDRNGGFQTRGFKPFKGNAKTTQEVVIGDLVVAHTDLTQDAEVLGNPAFIFDDGGFDKMFITMDLVKVISKNEDVSSSFLYYLMKDRLFKGHCVGYSNGTTVLHLSKKAIPEYQIILPLNFDLIKKFSEISDATTTKISLNKEAIKTLTKTRDTLLPKLMSGEIRVNEFRRNETCVAHKPSPTQAP